MDPYKARLLLSRQSLMHSLNWSVRLTQSLAVTGSLPSGSQQSFDNVPGLATVGDTHTALIGAAGFIAGFGLFGFSQASQPSTAPGSTVPDSGAEEQSSADEACTPRTSGRHVCAYSSSWRWHLQQALLPRIVLCDALPPPVGSTSGSDAAGSSTAMEKALYAVQGALSAAWAEVQQDMDRINAQSAAHSPQIQGCAPTASLICTKQQPVMEVVIPLRPGADADAVLLELRAISTGAYTSYKSSQSGTSRTVNIEVRPAHPSEGTLRAQLFVPPDGGSEQAALTIAKQGAGFSTSELAGMARVLRAANLSGDTSSSAGALGSTSSRHDFGRNESLHVEDIFGGGSNMAGRVFGSLFGGVMSEMLQAMQEEMQRLEEAAQGGSEAPLYPNGGGIPPFPGQGPGPAHGPVSPRNTQRVLGGDASDGGASGRSGSAYEVAGHDWGSREAAAAVQQLLGMGAQVFPPGSKEKMDWGVLAGYDAQKRTIEDCLLMPLMRPDVYARLTLATRTTPGSNRPRAVLFEGPPGTGKTTAARIISSQAAVPLVYLPLEAVLSKWYGESEGLLAKVFKAAEALGGAIIFLDELDALGGSREGGGLHEASRRLLSVLLREMEGFDENKKTVVIGATNRKADLDPALLSRFDLAITFGLPDDECRAQILAQYARQLSPQQRVQLAASTPGMSGRDLRDICEHAERAWAAKIIRGEVAEDKLPTLEEYAKAARERLEAIQSAQRANYNAGQQLQDLINGGGNKPGFGWPLWR